MGAVNSVTPVFLISLPRSGSTLLQKMLMSHSKIASHSEPWFLLPLIYTGLMGEDAEVGSEYGQRSARVALGHLFSSLRGGKDFYRNKIAALVEGVYEELSAGKEFFVDKTPRYYFILEELYQLFPQAKFIILLRDPLSVFSSSIEAFSKDSFRRIDRLDRDFYVGPSKISHFAKKMADAKNVLEVNYENLVASPSDTLRELCDFLGVNFEEGMVTNFSSSTLNGYGDHLGAKKYQTIVQDPLRWRKKINSWFRKKAATQYAKRYDKEYLALLGISNSQCISRVKAVRVTRIGWKDGFFLLEAWVVKMVKKIMRYRTLS